MASFLPSIGLNAKAQENFTLLQKLLPIDAKILVVGGRILGNGLDSLYEVDSYEIIGLDISFGPYTKIISDAHSIPFEDSSFDCVIIQAVLEHVLDPHRCVAEIERSLSCRV